MNFPDGDLPLLVEAYYGQWVDLSDRLTNTPVSIPQRGAPSGARSTAASSCRVTLTDDDGALTPLNPVGQYYPNVRRGAPMRVAIRRQTDDFARTVAAGWGNPADGEVTWVSFGAGGTISATDATVSGGMARHWVPDANAYRASYLDGLALVDCEVRVIVDTFISNVAGAPIEPANIMLRGQDISTYYLARVEVSTAEAVSVSLHHSTAGIIAGPVTVPGLVFAGQPLAVRAACAGSQLSLMIWDPATTSEPLVWQVTGVGDQIAVPGWVGIRSGVAAGNSNTKPVEFRYSNFEVRVYRAYGHAASYRPTLVPRTDRTLVAAQTIEIGGLLRRLERGRSGPRSALTRHIASTGPIAWWPLEDGVDSTRAASGLAGGAPMAVAAGLMDFVDEAPPGATGSAHPEPSAVNQLVGAVSGGSATAWQVAVAAKAVPEEAIPPSGFAFWIPVEITTSVGRVLRLVQRRNANAADPMYAIAIYANETADTELAFVGLAGATVGEDWHLCQFTAAQTGSDVSLQLYFDGALVASGTVAGTTLGAPVRVAAISGFRGSDGEYVPSAGMAELWISQLGLHNGATLVPLWDATLGYPGELAAARVARLCAEDSVQVAVTDGPDDSAAMGPQRPDTLVGLLRECESADFGILGESRSDLALTYRTGSARCNLPVSLVVDLATYQTGQGTSASVLAPVYDDQGLRNRVEASRVNGSSYTESDPESIAADELYDDPTEVNVAADDQLPGIATWLVHEGTVDEYRNPALPLDLAANPGLIDAWLGCDSGSRVHRTNPPRPHPPGPIDQIITGYSETLGPRQWTASASCQPASPWDVATVDGEQRVPADGSTLGAGLTDSGLVLSVASTGGIWTTNPADFPLLVRVGGEDIRLDSAGQVLNANPVLATDASGWVGSNATIARDLTHVLNEEWGALKATPDGTSASGGANGVARVPVTASAQYLAMIWVWATTSMQLGPAVDWFTATSGGSYISTSIVGPTTVTAGTWTLLSSVITAPATAAGAVMRARHAGTPPASSMWWVTGIALIPVTSYNASPQQMTIGARGVNGITRAWDAGTPVDVADPAIVSL